MTSEQVVVPKWAWIGVLILALLGLGWMISPRDIANRPALLLPDVKAVEDYRIRVSVWYGRMKFLDAEMTTILSGKFGSDLFSKSREAQKVTEAVIQLAQEIERQDVPTAAIPAKSMLIESASAYMTASRAILQWVSASTDENLAAAQLSLESARVALEQLEQSEWINP